MPSMKKVRNDGDTSQRPSVPVNDAKKPMANEPVTLMTSVPHGKVSPKCRATTPESQKRLTLPSAPPIATQRYISIKILLPTTTDSTDVGRSHQSRCIGPVYPSGVGKLHCHRQLCNRNENLAIQNGRGDPFPAIWEVI